LRLSLVEASDGKIGTLADQLTLICYRFDHLSQGYALSIMRVVQIGGVLTLLIMGTGIALALRWERRRAASQAARVAAAPPSHTENGKPEGNA
jgi:protein SCO1/2